jgi:hypothetical protein
MAFIVLSLTFTLNKWCGLAAIPFYLHIIWKVNNIKLRTAEVSDYKKTITKAAILALLFLTVLFCRRLFLSNILNQKYLVAVDLGMFLMTLYFSLPIMGTYCPSDD